MVADVPLGAFLSGGLDSSSIVALMAAAGGIVRTFSIGFGDPGFDETQHAEAVARAFGTKHESFAVNPDAAALLPRLIRHVGEPFADSSLLPTYLVSEATRQHVTVALAGDGGDEMLAGYDRYRAMALAARVPAPIGRAVGRVAAALPATGHHLRSRVARARRFALGLADNPSARYARWTGLFSPETLSALRGPALAAQPAPATGAAAASVAVGNGELDDLLRYDVERYLPEDLLVKADAASMAASLEVRAPFLDHQLAEFCASLPPGVKIGKAPLRVAMKDRLPPEILTRKKVGFGVPMARWLRGSLGSTVGDALVSLAQRGVVDGATGQRLLDDHVAGRDDHSAGLFGLWSLEEWYRAFLPG
jgi:asparagine synthase (glutamine-hydrolysing)